MTPKRWQKLKQIFNHALELEGGERKAYLEEVCGEDHKLREEAESLLEAYDTPGALDHPPGKLMTSVLSRHAANEKKGEQVGPYKILKVLGHGGMGSVYLAERDDGQFEQRVALKLLRTGFTSDNQSRRFLAERQILAALNHENIARLLDGGVTDDGQPWFAMEYVDGHPIDEYCDAHQLNIPQRLNIFLNVCDAIQSAHGKLVVHRDLKPSNIFVTKEGKVKLLDFGIAKVLDSDREFPEQSRLTKPGLLPLTPAYASPEQVRGDAMTTASDVYQLGLVLYELLTGCRPYKVSNRTPSEVERIICEEQPTRPSTAVTNVLADQNDTARISNNISWNRKTPAAHLLKAIKGDLDTILLKTLRKEPDRRYDSVEQLAADLRHYLNGRPVNAHPDSLSYRAGKFIRRHKTGVAATAAIVVLLIGYAATITRHSQHIQAALEQAQQETAKAEQVTGFLIDMFEAANPANTLGDTVNTRGLLKRGVAQAEQLVGQPDIQARMFDVAGRVYLALGQYKEARPLIERGLQLRKEIYGDNHLIISENLHNLAHLHKQDGNYEQAGKLYQRALDLRLEHLPPQDPRIAESLYHLGMYYQRAKSDMETAETYIRQSLEIRNSAYPSRHELIAESLRGLGGVLMARGKYTEAERYYSEALQIQKHVLGEKHPETLTTLNNMAILKAWSGDYDSATSLLKESLDQRHEVLGPGHHSSAIQLNNLAFIAGHQGTYNEAEHLLKQALSIMRASVGVDHPHALVFKTNLARIKHINGEYERAEELHREALNTKRDRLGPNHPDVAASLVQLGSLLNDQHRYKEARSLLREAISLHQHALEEKGPMLISAHYLLGQIHMSLGNYQEAGDLFHKTLKIRKQTRAVDHPDIAVAHSLQGACLTDLEVYVEAESLITEVQSLLHKFNGEDQSLKKQLIKQIINLYEMWEKPGDAEKYRKMLTSTDTKS